jgi:hypothetical protein
LSISGHISYADPNGPVKNVVMTLTSATYPTQTTVTDLNGDYTFTGLPSGNTYTVTPSKLDDLNNIESLDASNAARYVAGLDLPTTSQRTAADADGDGILTSYDAALIARYAAGLPDHGIVGTWKFVPVNRIYVLLNANQTNQNYVGVLVGDTSGNWAASRPAGPASERSWVDAETGADASLPQPSNGVTLSLPRARALPGASIMVPVQVSELTGRGVRAFDLDIAYDPSMLAPADGLVDTAGTLSAGMAVTVNAANSGHLIVSAFNTTDIAGSGTLLNLRFTVTGAAGQSAYLGFADFTDANRIYHPAARLNAGQPLAVTTKGAVVIGGNDIDSISGRVLTDDGRPVRNAMVTLTGNSLRTPLRTVTTSFGTYSFSGLRPGEVYVVTVAAQRFVFHDPSRVVTLVDNVINQDFVADPTQTIR